MKKRCWIMAAACLFLMACGNQENTTYEKQAEEMICHTVDTQSAYATSFRELQGYDKAVVYLGMPRELDTTEGYTWKSSDESIATIEDGMICGWKEGVVTVEKMDASGKALEETEYVVTTFNDGKQCQSCYEIGRQGDVFYPRSVDAELLKTKINTIQDSIYYFQNCDFTVDWDAPVVGTDESCWIWGVPGKATLLLHKGCVYEMAQAATYLLQNDFEDWGYIFTLGHSLWVYNWFYEDGTYYVMNYGEVVMDLSNGIADRDYVPLKAASLEELGPQIMTDLSEDRTMAVIAVSALKGEEIPPIQLSYLHNSDDIYSSHVQIGLEKTYFDTMKVLYENSSFDFEILSYLPEEMPLEVPRVAEKRFFSYE